MFRPLSAAALLLLAACGDGQPFVFPDEEETTEEDSGEGPGDSIRRSEERDADGGGFVTAVQYDAASDSFSVDNIPFDGDRPYERQARFDSLNGFALYDSVGSFGDDSVVLDPETGARIRQFDYRAIYGESRDTTRVDGQLQPRSRFAIIRTGDYRSYGFGGFLYERNGGVEIPKDGQAVFSGDYAGIRVFDGGTGLEYSSGDVEIAVDFEDFTEDDGLRGVVYNRRIFNSAGRELAVLGPNDPLNDEALVAPPLTFDVGPGVVQSNGEISGTASSTRELEDGGTEVFEEGTFMGIIGGEAQEIVGIVVIDSTDPRYEGRIKVRETGGFIVYR